MAARVASLATVVAGAVNLSRARQIVDVGGGTGTVLAAFLHRWPQAHGVLFDLPAAAAAGAERLAAAGLSERVEAVGGDFFRAVPTGADVYLLSQILHDWNDAQGTQVLRTIREAVAPDGRLLIIELLMPERVSGPHPVVDLDLLMLVLTGGQERTVPQYRHLLAGAGWTLTGISPGTTPGDMAVLEARPS